MNKRIMLILAIAATVVASLFASDVTPQAQATQNNPPPTLEGPNGEHKVVVCKYVGTPGVNETLQTGQNPIVVDYHALGAGFTGNFPFAFNDAQGQSIAVQWTNDQHFSDIGVCPPPDGPELDCSGDTNPDNNGPNGDCTPGEPQTHVVCQNGEMVEVPIDVEGDGSCNGNGEELDCSGDTNPDNNGPNGDCTTDEPGEPNEPGGGGLIPPVTTGGNTPNENDGPPSVVPSNPGASTPAPGTELPQSL